MTLDPELRSRLMLPAVCAPMYTVTGPELVDAACAAGVLGVLPRNNATSDATFEAWLDDVTGRLDALRSSDPTRRIAPLGANIRISLPRDYRERLLAMCALSRV